MLKTAHLLELHAVHGKRRGKSAILQDKTYQGEFPYYICRVFIYQVEGNIGSVDSVSRWIQDIKGIVVIRSKGINGSADISACFGQFFQ